MYYLTAQVVDNYDEIRLKDVFKIHSENPYIHSIIENGKIEYKKQYSNEDYRVFVWTNAWEPENVFFQSMLYSGKLLEIKNKRLRKEVESIYTKQEERVSGMFKISGNISSDILKWFDEKENEFSKDISTAEIFDFHKDQKLKNALSKREKQLSERIIDLENYLQALQNVVMLISTEYKKI